MENSLKIFSNLEFGEIRIVVINSEPWFVGKDVAVALGYSDTADAVRNHVDNDDKMGGQNTDPYIIDSMGRKQYPVFINESGIYSLVFGSKLPNAKKFKHWVTSDVLPTIRKHGVYAVDELINDPELAIKAFTALKEEREKNKALQEENDRMRPKEIFADAVSASDSSMLVRDLAKIIRQNGVPIGEKRFYKWLRENGYICKGSTSPTQKAMELGLFEVIIRTIDRGDGLPIETKTTKVTGKGQQYFINKFLNKTA